MDVDEATYRLAIVRELRRQALAIEPAARLEWFTSHVAQANLFPASPFREGVVRELLAAVVERAENGSLLPVMGTLIVEENKARFAFEAARKGVVT